VAVPLVLVGALLTLPLTALGACLKWVDLVRRFDTLVEKTAAVTPHFPFFLEMYSRLGDRLIANLNAKVLAGERSCNYLRMPFQGDRFFYFVQHPGPKQLEGPCYFRHVVDLGKIDKDKWPASFIGSTLYQLPFFSHRQSLNGPQSYTISWASHQLELHEWLGVVGEYTKIPFRDGSIRIGLHVRDGGDFDDDVTKSLHPLKLPCLDFYKGELKKLLKTVSKQPVDVHIFTDALDPERLYREIDADLKTYGEKKNVQVTFTKREKTSLKDDIANMLRVHWMIRADSNLSGPLGDASGKRQLEVFPSEARMDEGCHQVVITQVTQRKLSRNGNVETIDQTRYTRNVGGWLPSWGIRYLQRMLDIHDVRMA
jgi:hypothetical protein